MNDVGHACTDHMSLLYLQCMYTYVCTVLEIMFSIQTFSDHFGILAFCPTSKE